MTKQGEWGWYAGPNEEEFTVGPEPTREAVISAAQDEEIGLDVREDGSTVFRFQIVEARKDGLRLSKFIDEAEGLLERACDAVSDSDRASENDDGDYFNVSAEQEADLNARIKRACDEWQDANGLTFTTWTFSAMRNEETITVEAPAQ